MLPAASKTCKSIHAYCHIAYASVLLQVLHKHLKGLQMQYATLLHACMLAHAWLASFQRWSLPSASPSRPSFWSTKEPPRYQGTRAIPRHMAVSGMPQVDRLWWSQSGRLLTSRRVLWGLGILFLLYLCTIRPAPTFNPESHFSRVTRSLRPRRVVLDTSRQWICFRPGISPLVIALRWSTRPGCLGLPLPRWLPADTLWQGHWFTGTLQSVRGLRTWMTRPCGPVTGQVEGDIVNVVCDVFGLSVTKPNVFLSLSLPESSTLSVCACVCVNL